jgi:hypothetical protein
MTLLKVDAVDYDSVNQICIGSQNTQFKEITKNKHLKYVMQNKNKELKIIDLFQK